MTGSIGSIVLLAALVIPSIASAQQPSNNIEMKAKRERAIVLPQPPIDTAVQDAEQVRRSLEAEGRRDEILRESRERPLSRPELDYSVASGIQADRVGRALRR